MAFDADIAVAVLVASAGRLRALVEGLDADQLRTQAYPSEWTVADVLCHLGAAAEMMRIRLEAFGDETSVPDDFAEPIWDAWNAKSPAAKAADALLADRGLISLIDGMSPDERARVTLPFGSMTADLTTFVGLRVNEHALHSWDIAVTFDPPATVPADAAGIIVDNLEVIVPFAGKPVGEPRELHVRTSAPRRDLTLSIGTDSVSLHPCRDDHVPEVELPAEAFGRLVYGRLDPEHTPPALRHVDLDGLRRVFPGL